MCIPENIERFRGLSAFLILLATSLVASVINRVFHLGPVYDPRWPEWLTRLLGLRVAFLILSPFALVFVGIKFEEAIERLGSQKHRDLVVGVRLIIGLAVAWSLVFIPIGGGGGMWPLDVFMERIYVSNLLHALGVSMLAMPLSGAITLALLPMLRRAR